MSGTAPTRNLGLDVVRATEAAALAASRWMGRGKPDEEVPAAARAAGRELALRVADGLPV